MELKKDVNEILQERIQRPPTHSRTKLVVVQAINFNMGMSMRDKLTLKTLVFHGTRKYDTEQHWFTYEAIWVVKHIIDDATKIVQFETTFRDNTLAWYMKHMVTTLAGQTRTLDDIKRDMLKEFQKPKFESQCIIGIEEIKQQVGNQCGIMIKELRFYWID